MEEGQVDPRLYRWWIKGGQARGPGHLQLVSQRQQVGQHHRAGLQDLVQHALSAVHHIAHQGRHPLRLQRGRGVLQGLQQQRDGVAQGGDVLRRDGLQHRVAVEREPHVLELNLAGSFVSGDL